jgi:hypothetical protein
VVVYILAPAGTYTGGPTALFQLCHALRKSGIDAIMAFYGKTCNDPVHPNYKKYRCPWTTVSEIIDEENSAIIVPETAVNRITCFTKVKKIIYWLAVDNYVLTTHKPSKLGFVSYIIKRYIFNPYVIYAFATKNIHLYYNAYLASYVKSFINTKAISIPNADLHLVQSKYAKDFLSNCGVEDEKILIIHEPLEEEFLMRAKEIKYHEKINAIAWNVRKAYPIAFKLVRMLRKNGFTVFDLKNVDKDRIIKILSKTKIFLDIGIHPGRDRPPREAVALDNITIVNNHGGCYNFDDCMIPAEFKWNCYLDHEINYQMCVKYIEHYLENFEYYIKKFYKFKQYIMQEPSLFLNDVHYLSSILIKWGVS